MADRQQAPLAPRLAVVALIALAVHRLGLLFYEPNVGLAAAWPASGVWLAMVLLSPRRVWRPTVAAILAVSVVANLLAFRSPAVTFGFVLANALEITLGAWTMLRWRGPCPSFTRIADIVALIFIATVINAIASVPGAWAGTLHGSAGFWEAYATWWTADALGILLVTPFVVSWVQGSALVELWTLRRRARAELAAFVVVWCTAAWLTYRDLDGNKIAPFSYVLVCMLVWAGLRHGIRLVSTAIVVLGTIALQAALSESAFAAQLTHTQLYLGIAAITGFFLVASTAERRAAEAATHHAEERLRIAVHSARMGAWLWDIDSNAVRWSDEVESIFGIAPGTFDQSYAGYLALIHPEDQDRVASTIKRAVDGETAYYTVEHRIVGTDGLVRWIEGVGRVFRDPRGRPVRMAGTVVDITRRKHLEEQLRRAQKMEALGQLAGGVAHDFNNTLAAIMMQAESCRTEDQPPEVTECMTEIIAAAQRAVNLTRQLLTFSRRNVMQLRVADLNEQVRELASMLGRIVGEHVTLRLELYDEPLLINGDAGMIDQVLMNLVVNARDAMPQGGRLVIQTTITTLDAEAAGALAGVPPGRYATLRVSDTGLGIPREDLEHLFEPFFTTKPMGQGTGLGLPTVFGIVTQHRGHILVDTEVGRGTAFEVLLPATLDGLAEASPPAPSSSPVGGTETILVVEDDSRLRRSTCTILRKHGYRVLEAASGVEALALFDTTREPIHLLYTDVVMPDGVSGFELATRLRARQPTLEVIFTSGYSAEIAPRDVELVPGWNFLQKPSPAQLILETIRKRLDAERA